MKKLLKTVSLLLVLVLFASMFAGCTTGTKITEVNVEITVDNATDGTAMDSVGIHVVANGEVISCRTEWTKLNDAKDAYEPVQGTLENGNDYMLHLYYNVGADADKDTELNVNVTGAELNYSELVGEEVMTVVRINLLEKGKLTITSGNNMVGMPLAASYCAVKLNGENLTITQSFWNVRNKGAMEPMAEDAIFEDGKYYQQTIYFIGPDDFDPADQEVYANCHEGQIVKIEAAGAEFMVLIAFDYTNGEVEEEHVCAFEVNPEKSSEATCTEDGETFYICSGCGAEKSEKVTASGHEIDWDHPVYVHDPNCTQKGEKAANCAHCDHQETQPIPADGKTHNFQQSGKTGNCETGLVITYKCSRCGAEKSETGAPASHAPDWNNPLYENKPNCTQPGEKAANCVHCGAQVTETSPADGMTHTFQQTGQEGTCTSGLYTHFKCIRCSKEMHRITPAGDHTFGPAEYWNNFRCVRTCTICGEQSVSAHVTDSNAICKNCGTAIIN